MRIFILILLLSSSALADSIVTRDGTIYAGTIRGATDSTVLILSEMNIVTVPAVDIIAIYFSYADAVYLRSGEVVAGKVAAKEGDTVIVATPQGTLRMHGSSIQQVKYNFKSEIKVPSLPGTNRHFNNISSPSSSYAENSSSVFIMLHISNHAAALDDWKKQFTGGTVETRGLIIGAEAGYVFKAHLMAAAGYEGFTVPTVEIRASSPTFDDVAFYTFVYASLLAGGRPVSTPEMFIYGGADLGRLTGTEGVKNLNGVDVDASNSMFAYRLKGGIRYMTSGSFSLVSELGYLHAPVKDLTMLGNTIPRYTLDFSGIFFRFGCSFHISTTTH
jgi:hypothetical protein